MKTYSIMGNQIPIPSLIQDWDYIIQDDEYYHSISFYKMIRNDFWMDVFYGEDSDNGEWMISFFHKDMNPSSREDRINFDRFLLHPIDDLKEKSIQSHQWGDSIFIENLYIRSRNLQFSNPSWIR